MNYKTISSNLGFSPQENTSGVYQKKYANLGGYRIEIDFEKEQINYGNKIKVESKTTQNFSQAENWVVLECVNRLLEKGYNPSNIILEKTWASGHGTSGRLDICVTRDDRSEYLLIECKTWGKEFEKEFSRLKKDGGQLFTYFKFSNKAYVIMLYASELDKKETIYRNEIIKIEDTYRTGDVKDFYSKWNKLTKDNGIFDEWVAPYEFISKALTPDQLKDIDQKHSGIIFHQFLEILRHNVVSDKPNAFNKIFTLFLCKIYDEKTTRKNEELDFQWLEGIDDDITFQTRLADLYKNGMKEFLDKKVTDFSEDEFDKKYASLFATDENLKIQLKKDIAKLRLEKNNEFAIKEVFDHKSFKENAIVVKQVVELLQEFKIRYTKKQQYLSDFFEMLLTTGLKQESGQFFTPVPIAQFIIKSMPLDELVNEKLQKGEQNNLLPYVIDYAAGSGHFVTEIMHEVQRILEKTDASKYISDTTIKIETWQKDHFYWAFQYVYGVEKDYRLVKVGKVGCYLHGDGLANVIHSDGLGSFIETEEYKDKLAITDSDFPKENKQFDIVVSNPPYSVQAFKQNARDYYTEKDFDLYSALTDNSSEIECLFVERTKQLLKDGGMAGIILPSSILSNTNIYTKAREIILQNFDIVAIAELGSNTFMATGTNTVTLFLRRRNNYDSINLRKSVRKFFTNLQDVTLNGIEKPVSKYIAHTWAGISFADYKTLLQKQPNETIQQHEIYQEYQKKIKAKNDQEKWNTILKIEEEKLFYFIIVYPQKVVLVKSGQKKAEKQFLGYYFSNRRGSEGIHPIQRGKSIDECTQLFDADAFDNPEKASTYIYKAFKGDFDFPVHESLQKNISCTNLVDMLSFDRVNFEKNISLSVRKVKTKSKWKLVTLSNVVEIIGGGTPDTNNPKYWGGVIPWLSIVDFNNNNRFVKTTEKTITEEGLQNSNAKYLNAGDIIISARGTVGAMAQLKIPMTFNQSCYGLRGNKEIDNAFLYYCLKAQIQQLQNSSYGTIFGAITTKTFSEIKIPLPPKEIQEKIIAEIEVLEQKEKNAVDMVEGLKDNINSLFKQSKSREAIKFTTVATLDYGKTLHRSDRKTGEYLVMGSNGVIGTHSKFLVEAPCIIIGRKGSAGKIRYVEKNCFPIDTTFYVSLDNLKANIKYFYYLLLDLNLEELAKGKGIGVPGLNRNDVHNLNISLPSLPKQKKVVSEVEKLEVQITELEKEINAIPEQKENILKKYLE